MQIIIKEWDDISFLTLNFLLFLLIVVTVYYLLPAKLRKYWIIASSYYFYACADIKMLAVLVSITLSTYLGGFLIHRSVKHKKALFSLFFALNMAILVVFKYTPFIVSSVNTLASAVKLPLVFNVPEILVPLGLSFFIFQSATYLGDIYRHGMEPVSLADHAAFVSFFPTLLSGPIQNSRQLIPQISNPKKNIDIKRFRGGMILVLYGMFEKLFIANSLAAVVNRVFDNYTSYNGLHYLIAAVLYSFQIYADFSSYSDIARGLALMLGINVTKNFQNPYLSESIADFWRNWHCSLNSWLIEYIYIPLGGSRKGKIKKYLNVMAVFLFSGLWHGASWHFVIWGAVNGLLQVIGQLTKKPRAALYDKLKLDKNDVLTVWRKRLTVFLLITTTWVFFRIPSTVGSLYIIKEMYSFSVSSFSIYTIFESINEFAAVFAGLALFIMVHIARKKEGKLYKAYNTSAPVVQIVLLAAAIAAVLMLICEGLTGTGSDSAFIYFQF